MVKIHMTRRTVAWLALAAAIVTGIAVWQLQGGGPPPPTPRLATAARGDVVVTVGGLGRVVGAGAPAQIPVPISSGSGAAGSAPTASYGAVLPRASGRVLSLLVVPGELVTVGQPVAVLDDGGSASLAVRLARDEVATAQLELTQKQTSDPSHGLPPTPGEITAAQLALTVARERLGLVLHPNSADVISAKLDVAKAKADLKTLQREPGAEAFAAAQLAIDVATQRLALVSGPPSQIDVTAAKLELAKAQAELASLQQAPSGPSPTAIQAAQLAVELARQKLADLDPSAPPSEVLAAQLELAKAQADLDALLRPQTSASAAALAAAQLAVDLAAQKLAELTGPPSPLAIAAVQLELRRAQAELEALQRSLPSAIAVEAGQLAVTLTKEKLVLVRNPSPAVRDAAQLEIASAAASLETLLKRGAPASAIDLAIAQLKLTAARAHLALAQAQADLLTVRSLFGGTVTSVLAARGTPADVSTPIATVIDLRHLAVSVDLSEFDVAQVSEGLPALVSVDALGGKSFRGKVLFAALAGVDNGGVVTFPVRVGLPRVGDVRLGMNCSVRIIVAERRNVVRVPIEAVTSEGGRSTVTVVDTSGRTTSRQVTLGLADNTYVEIRAGLRDGERVVLGG